MLVSALSLVGCSSGADSTGQAQNQGVDQSNNTNPGQNKSNPVVEVDSWNYAEVYSFGSNPANASIDGQNARAGLIFDNTTGLLYGTTSEGGASNSGMIYTINPKTGAENIVYSFNNLDDANFPNSSLTEYNGMLYGTAFSGNNLCGNSAIFTLNSSNNKEAFIPALSDLSGVIGYIDSGLIQYGDKLYGTSVGGGTYGQGVVYSIDANNNQTLIYSFNGEFDGVNPQSDLAEHDGLLYGTAPRGGEYGNGAVFSVDPSTGKEEVLYSFAANGDGRNPVGGLVVVNNKLYGTTPAGDGSVGDVFSIDISSHKETILHAFAGVDGDSPDAGLIQYSLDGKLYGVTSFGGDYGNGVVYSIDPNDNDAYSIVYSLPSDGLSNLIARLYENPTDHALYGVANQGGSSNNGGVFKLTPVIGASN